MGIKYPAWKRVLICSLWYFLLLRLAVAIALVLILKPDEQFTEQRNERTNDHFDRICFDFQTSHFQWTQAKLLLWLLFSICAKRMHRKQLRVESWQSLSDSVLLWSCNKGQLLKHQMQITLPVVISLRRIHSTLLRLWPVKGGSGIWI